MSMYVQSSNESSKVSSVGRFILFGDGVESLEQSANIEIGIFSVNRNRLGPIGIIDDVGNVVFVRNFISGDFNNVNVFVRGSRIHHTFSGIDALILEKHRRWGAEKER